MNNEIPGQVLQDDDHTDSLFDFDVNQDIHTNVVETNKYEELIYEDLKPVKFSSRIEVLINTLSSAFLPLKQTFLEIERAFGSTCAYYFSLCRSVLGAIFLLSLLSGVLLYKHIKELLENDQSVFLIFSGFYPTLFLPSTLSYVLKIYWTFFIIFGYFIVIVFAGMFILYSSRLMYRYDAIQAGRTRDTPTFMNIIYSWNWNKKSKYEADHERYIMNEDLTFAMNGCRIFRENKPDQQKATTARSIKRSRVYATLLFVSWTVLIFFVSLRLSQYQPSDSDQDEWVATAVSLFFSIWVALANLVSPKICDSILALEYHYDDVQRSAARLRFLICFRLVLLGPIMNDAISMLYFPVENLTDCPLNLVTKNVQNLMFVSFVLDITVPFTLRVTQIFILFMSGVYKKKSREEIVQMRPEFNYQDYALKLVYHYMLTITSLPFSPFTPIISFFLAYINAKYVKWFMKHFLKPPRIMYRTEKSRFTFSLYLMLPISLCGAFLSTFVSARHPCGPFSSHETPKDAIIVLHPMFWVPMAFVFFAWFRSTVGFTKAHCYREQLLLRRKATNVAIANLKKKILRIRIHVDHH
ncbi:hypothetical protein P9112_009500 [Eukaryota sp. TZLM1-RC]